MFLVILGLAFDFMDLQFRDWVWMVLAGLKWLALPDLPFRFVSFLLQKLHCLCLSVSLSFFSGVWGCPGISWTSLIGIKSRYPSPYGNRHLDDFLNFLHIHPPFMFSLQTLTFPGLQVEIPIVSAGLNWLAGSGRIIWAVSAGCKKDFYFNSPLYFPRLSVWNFPLYSLDLNDWLGLGTISSYVGLEFKEPMNFYELCAYWNPVVCCFYGGSA